MGSTHSIRAKMSTKRVHNPLTTTSITLLDFFDAFILLFFIVAAKSFTVTSVYWTQGSGRDSGPKRW
jgi:hypothetical protein